LKYILFAYDVWNLLEQLLRKKNRGQIFNVIAKESDLPSMTANWVIKRMREIVNVRNFILESTKWVKRG